MSAQKEKDRIGVVWGSVLEMELVWLVSENNELEALLECVHVEKGLTRTVQG